MDARPLLRAGAETPSHLTGNGPAGFWPRAATDQEGTPQQSGEEVVPVGLPVSEGIQEPTLAEHPAPASGPTARLSFWHYAILISLNSIGAFSSDCYIPNLSDVVDDLKTTDEEVSLTIQINWIVLGLFTPIVGHLSDVYGRRLVVSVTLLVYIAGALGSAFAPTIGWLLAARCVQGMGESVSIITGSIIRDTVDDPQERTKIQAYFTTMRPLMLLGGPSIGGVIGAAYGWRDLMKGLACWGVLNLVLMYFLPESLPAPDGAPKPRQHIKGPCSILCPGLNVEKFHRMIHNVDFVGLSVSAALCMGAVRAMLSNISFVYDHYYGLSTSLSGLLISVPTMAGFISALLAGRMAAGTKPGTLMLWGMAAGVLPPLLMLVSAGVPDAENQLYAKPRFYMTTIPCSLLAAVGFFALPPMQVLVLQDFKDMSGLAGGISKLVMTLTSTGLSMLASFYFSDWGKDRKEADDCKPNCYTHGHTQRLLYSLAAILLLWQLWFWLVYGSMSSAGRRRAGVGPQPEPQAEQ